MDSATRDRVRKVGSIEVLFTALSNPGGQWVVWTPEVQARIGGTTEERAPMALLFPESCGAEVFTNSEAALAFMVRNGANDSEASEALMRAERRAGVVFRAGVNKRATGGRKMIRRRFRKAFNGAGVLVQYIDEAIERLQDVGGEFGGPVSMAIDEEEMDDAPETDEFIQLMMQLDGIVLSLEQLRRKVGGTLERTEYTGVE